MRTQLLRAAAPLVLVLGLVLAPITTATEPEDPPTAQIADSNCTSDLPWKTGAGTYGQVKHCYFVYKLDPTDPAVDHYLIETTSEWSPWLSWNKLQGALTTVEVTSDHPAVDSDYSMEPNQQDLFICGEEATFAFVLGTIGLESPANFCNANQLRLAGGGENGALWYSPNALDLGIVQTSYMQKVKAGDQPIFTVRFGHPDGDESKFTTFTTR